MFETDSERDAASKNVTRRAFVLSGVAAFAGLGIWSLRHRSVVQAGIIPQQPGDVQIVEFTDAGVRKGLVTLPKVIKSDEEWRKQLTPGAFQITRQADTEVPFTGSLLRVHDKGVFRCICCDTALFNGDTKFDSGTGWPSFWAPIAKENVLETEDRTLGMGRTAVSCRRCDAHLGHVFDDGPQPTGLRYCMNSVALRFAKAS